MCNCKKAVRHYRTNFKSTIDLGFKNVQVPYVLVSYHQYDDRMLSVTLGEQQQDIFKTLS